MTVTLEQLLPQSQKFQIRGKEFSLRPANIGDIAWIRQNFGNEDIKITQDNPESLLKFCQVAFRLLDDEYKPLFKSKTVDKYDELSETSSPVKLEPYEVFMSILSPFDLQSLAEAFARSMGAGDLSTEELKEYAENAEKKRVKAKSKTGPRSMTRSRANTARA